jgi:hypothetical protein
MSEIPKIRSYWEGNTPQHWYSDKTPGTTGYFEDIQKYRYSRAYPYLPEFAEFEPLFSSVSISPGICGI